MYGNNYSFFDPPKQTAKKHLKIVMAGFPCTEFSIAQSKKRINRIDFTADEFIEWHNSTPEWWLHISEFEKQVGKKLGIPNYSFANGLQLFLNCIVAIDRLNILGEKVYYLFENVASMQKSIKVVMEEILSKLYGGKMIEINSALVSAQNRKRVYFTNFDCEIPQPQDRGILLRDVLDNAIAFQEKSYCLDANYYKGSSLEHTLQKSVRTMVAEPVACRCRGRIDQNGNGYAKYEVRSDGKANTLDTNTINGSMVAEPIRIGTIEHEGGYQHDSKQYRVYSPDGKATTLCGQGGGVGAKTGLYACPINDIKDKARTLTANYYKASARDAIIECAGGRTLVCQSWDGKTYPVYEVKNGLIEIKGKTYPIKLPDGLYIIRKLTVIECRRLQTIPDWYQMPCSASQNYKMLGNGWTIEVIKHILSHIPNISDCTVEVLSMYSGMNCDLITLTELGTKIVRCVDYEIDKYAIQTASTNFPCIEHRGDAFQLRNTNWSY